MTVMIDRASLRLGFLATLILMVCSSCEKMVINEEGTSEQPGNANLILRVSKKSFHPYENETKAVVDVADYCTRFNFVLYQDGKKVKAVSQLKEEAGANFGQVAMSVTTGTYQLMVLAHSSVGGNPVLSNPEEIQFTNKLGYSDTFCYYGTIEVTSEQATHDILLQRATTMVRFNFDEVFPENMGNMKIYYTGESGVLNAMTGFGGTTNSKQEKIVNLSSFAGQHKTYSLPIYTFMRQETGTLDITITAYTTEGEVIVQRSFEDVPVEHTKATEFEGEFFEHESEQAFTFKVDTDWEVATTIRY